MQNNKNNLNIFATLRDIFYSYLQHWSDVAKLASLESKLALQTIVKISIAIYLLGFLLISTWITLLVILFFYLLFLKLSVLAAAGSVLLIHILLIASFLWYVINAKKYLRFAATRRQLAQTKEEEILE